MRICYLSHSGSHFSAPYVEYFAAAGHEVHLISLQQGSVPHAIMHHPLRRAVNPERAGAVYLWAHRAIRRVLQEIRPDVVHAHYVTSNGFMAARTGFHPLVVSARGSDVNQALTHPIRRHLVRYAMRRADLVNVVSAELERKVLGLGVPPEKLLRLTQGIEVERFSSRRETRLPGPPRLICTRRIEAVYQCERIVRALARLAADHIDFQFTFAAGGPDEANVRRQVQAAGLEGRVRFLGGYQYDALPGILANGDIYVSASLSDGTSPSLLEAMASGLFPVVSDISGNREWLSGDGDCLFFDSCSDDALVACLATAIRESHRWPAAAVANYARVSRDADRNRNMAILAEHYRWLVEGQPLTFSAAGAAR